MIRSRFVAGPVLLAGTVLLAVGCEDPKGPGTTPTGDVLVVLDSPADDDGALLLTIRGPGTPTVAAASSSYLVYSKALENGDVRVAVFGHITDGPVLAMTSTEAQQVTLGQVAGRDNSLRTTLSGYSVSIVSQ